MSDGLGRRTPTDFEHVERYPLRLVSPTTISKVERVLPLWKRGADQPLREWYDQGSEGACVGFSCSYMMTILNQKLYAARWLYREAQLIDEWQDTPPEEGTSVRAGFDMLRNTGHRRVWRGITLPAMFGDGIAANRWAQTVDELRTSIALSAPGVLGINWYANFDRPVERYGEHWIGVDQASGTTLRDWGRVRGGHAIVFRGASDKRQALRLTNSWGLNYPDVWLPFDAAQRLIYENGEAGIVVDR